MANRRSRREAIRDVASYIAQRVLAAAIGVAIYFCMARFIVIEQKDQIASAFFTIAGVVGVVAGFLVQPCSSSRARPVPRSSESDPTTDRTSIPCSSARWQF